MSARLDINILGEFNLSGEFWQVKPLFEKLGIRIRCLHPGRRALSPTSPPRTARAST